MEQPAPDDAKWLSRANDVVVDWERRNCLPLLYTRQAGDLTRSIAGALARAYRLGRGPADAQAAAQRYEVAHGITSGVTARSLSSGADDVVRVVTDTHAGQPYRWELRPVRYPAARVVVTDARALDPGGAAHLPIDALWLELQVTGWPTDAQLPPAGAPATVEARHDQVTACSCGGPPCPHAVLYAWARAQGWQPPAPSHGERLARLRDRAMYLVNRILGLT